MKQETILIGVITFAVAILFVLLLVAVPVAQTILLWLLIVHLLAAAGYWLFARGVPRFKLGRLRRSPKSPPPDGPQEFSSPAPRPVEDPSSLPAAQAPSDATNTRQPADLPRRTAPTAAQRNRIAKLKKVDWMRLNKSAFEDYLRQVFEAHQCVAVPTTNPKDHGVDLVVTIHRMRIAVAVKEQTGATGNSAVLQALAGMPHHHCQQSMVVSRGTFTSAARELAESRGTLLIDRLQMPRLIAGTHSVYLT